MAYERVKPTYLLLAFLKIWQCCTVSEHSNECFSNVLQCDIGCALVELVTNLSHCEGLGLLFVHLEYVILCSLSSVNRYEVQSNYFPPGCEMILLLLTETSHARCSYLELGCNLWLLSNAVLGPCVCCSIWGFCIQRKWQTRRKCVCIKFCFTLGRNAKGTFEILYLLKSGQLEEHTFLHCFPRSKTVCFCWRWQAKQMKMWTEWRNLFSQIGESLSVKLLWISFGSF